MGRTPTGHGLTVVGNLAVDRVDGRPPSAGGCPSFAAIALAQLDVCVHITTKRARSDQAIFGDPPAVNCLTMTVLDAPVTNAFKLDYRGEQRTLTVSLVGEPWTAEQLCDNATGTIWIHAAPLLRGEFPLPTLAALRAAGHRISFDGQGLVRIPSVGPMRLDTAYDPDILRQLTVLKLADEEARVIAGGEFTTAHASRLGVPEILVTFGSTGADLYLDGRCTHIVPERRVDGVHTTGSGDMFAVSYVAARAVGTEPVAAAQAACDLVAGELARRRAGQRL